MNAKRRDVSRVRVGEAKGRPLLTWVGKRPLRHVVALPSQEVERFALDGPIAQDVPWGEWPTGYPQGGLLFHGENEDVLGNLLANGFRGTVDLVYIDPPFDSGADYVRHVQLRGARGTARLTGEGYSLGEQVQYTDIWGNDNYLQFMYERLLLLRELLSPTGSFYLHADAHRVHHLRLLLDEVFGSDWFKNHISWRRTSSHGGANRFGSVTDFLLFYSAPGAVWHPQFQEMTKAHLDRHYRHRDEKGVYALGELTAPGVRRGPTGQRWHGFDVTAIGRHWGNLPEELDRLDQEGLIYWPEKEGAWPRLRRYLDDSRGRPGTDFWDDIDPINMVGLERTDYPTQKPEALLERIISASSSPGDLVLDCFLGSGTTAIVAQRLGRRWIGADINKGAVQTCAKGVIDEMLRQAKRGHSRQTTLDGTEEVLPAQLSFATYRVNDYDLTIQHNEAVELACRALGVERLKTDGFFDGSLGRQLVRILPFDHPASPLDVEEVISELRNRPTEERDIVIVALGKELACEARLAEHNRPGAPNKITLIELRTDPKVAGFFAHEPASADVRLDEADGRVRVIIDDFVSPTILERLRQQDGLVSPQITDWRAMVDSVMIDTSYNGDVFEVGIADVPERKSDLVAGDYELSAESVGDTVAVRITDMLGEEVLVVVDRRRVRS